MEFQSKEYYVLCNSYVSFHHAFWDYSKHLLKYHYSAIPPNTANQYEAKYFVAESKNLE